MMNNVIKVWDLPLRLFHWLLVIGFFTAYFTEDELLDVHTWGGYTVLALLLFCFQVCAPLQPCLPPLLACFQKASSRTMCDSSR